MAPRITARGGRSFFFCVCRRNSDGYNGKSREGATCFSCGNLGGKDCIPTDRPLRYYLFLFMRLFASENPKGAKIAEQSGGLEGCDPICVGPFVSVEVGWIEEDRKLLQYF